MEENKLILNSDKTEAIYFSASSSVNITFQFPHTIILSDTEIKFSGFVHNLDFNFDAIFQWNSMSSKHGKQHTLKSDA